MSTRPRIGFDGNGRCNACQWAETKKTLDWDARLNELNDLLDSVRRSDGKFDCLVPVSGGKDGSYVAYNLKHKYGMNPLAVTVTPALALELGEENLPDGISQFKIGLRPCDVDAGDNQRRVVVQGKAIRDISAVNIAMADQLIGLIQRVDAPDSNIAIERAATEA